MNILKKEKNKYYMFNVFDVTIYNTGKPDYLAIGLFCLFYVLGGFLAHLFFYILYWMGYLFFNIYKKVDKKL